MAKMIEYPRIAFTIGTARNLKRGFFVGRISSKSETPERLWTCAHEHKAEPEAKRCAEKAFDEMYYTGRCRVPRAYRSMADIGSTAICGAPIKTERGFCLRHDPVLGPKRDKSGRIIPKEEK